jgi:hypothetical protein
MRKRKRVCVYACGFNDRENIAVFQKARTVVCVWVCE